LQFTKEYLEF